MNVHAWKYFGVVGLAAVLASGCERGSSERAAPTPSASSSGGELELARVQDVTVVGTNYCLGCALKKEQGAAAQCSQYGHRHALKVESARGANGALPQLVGHSLHYLDNDQSAKLVSGDEFHGKTVEVHGKLFGAERIIEVREASAR